MTASKDELLYPKYSYKGKPTASNIVFDWNLQEFSDKVMYLCALENSGKIDSIDAYNQIKQLWKELKASKKNIVDGFDAS